MRGRPLVVNRDLIRDPCCFKLPRWLIAWLRSQNESQSVLIERALIDYYSISVNSVNKSNSLDSDNLKLEL